MHGDGTKTGITISSPTAYCLDLTRLISRVGRGQLTGIDRVELEYLKRLSAIDIPTFALIRTRFGFLLLDQSGMVSALQRLLMLLDENNQPSSRARYMRYLRHVALTRCLRLGLKTMLAKYLFDGVEYYNVGHSNITEPVFSAVQGLVDSKISVLLHDVIPLEYPEFQREGSVVAFKCKLDVIAKFADRVIFPSEVSKVSGLDVLAGRSWGSEVTVAHLGVVKTAKIDTNLAPKKRSRPYFVTIGTIEPRKNHALLLDVWEKLSSEENAPELVIVGRRGWKNEDVFRRLDAKPANVTEINDLSDEKLAGLLSGASALLFPSYAEGFGLPPAEASQYNLSVISNDLAVIRETLGDYPIYVKISDMYQWYTTIQTIADHQETTGIRATRGDITLPTWNDHFNIVLRLK